MCQLTISDSDTTGKAGYLKTKNSRGRTRASWREAEFTIRPVVRNGWTAKQAESGLLRRWSERPENDRLVDLLALKLTATGSNGTLKSTHCLTYCL